MGRSPPMPAQGSLVASRHFKLLQQVGWQSPPHGRWKCSIGSIQENLWGRDDFKGFSGHFYRQLY